MTEALLANLACHGLGRDRSLRRPINQGLVRLMTISAERALILRRVQPLLARLALRLDLEDVGLLVRLLDWLLQRLSRILVHLGSSISNMCGLLVIK